ncbi:hypothetical protein IU443_28155 [Nocardia farcinica]|uniref:hypothetical protein n=1 Tax=Nocardia farcinica TaxID=37329 RepID=UPI0018960066|nr:hypothetical protein [Nocardia farcinica]MBF6393805.1 hypothetical protein [Nocardia farcinica]MBF6411265.1 hypothetical protein [Nocardia farcinica]MCZ9330240.1 hypothetical protein [Nocardia farcinica]UEX26218.1 hypothetical protein LMJ57_30165 [Nocardia farcinica]
MYPSLEEVRAELTGLAAECGVTVAESSPSVLYAHADDPRAAAAALRERLRRSVFRERAVRSGDEETFITVLDPIDRTVTIKVRRVLSTGAVA